MVLVRNAELTASLSVFSSLNVYFIEGLVLPLFPGASASSRLLFFLALFIFSVDHSIALSVPQMLTQSFEFCCTALCLIILQQSFRFLLRQSLLVFRLQELLVRVPDVLDANSSHVDARA